MEDSAQLFVSYCSAETGAAGDGFAVRLQQELLSRGYTALLLCSNEQEDEWDEVVRPAIERCKAFVAVCSTSYSTSRARREFELGHGVKKPLIPVWHSGGFPTHPALYLSVGNRVPRGCNAPAAINSWPLDVLAAAVHSDLELVLEGLGITPRVRERMPEGVS